MDTGAALRPPRLTDMVTVRAPSGFGDRIREAARMEGCRPGALIREAVSERIARVGGEPSMTPEDRATVVAVAGEQLAQKIERAAVDAEYRDDIGREVDAARFRHMDRLIAAHGHLGAYIAIQASRPVDGSESPEEIAHAETQIRLAHAEMAAARAIAVDLAWFVVGGEA